LRQVVNKKVTVDAPEPTTKCLRNGGGTCKFKVLSSFNVFPRGQWRLRKATTAQTPNLWAMYYQVSYLCSMTQLESIKDLLLKLKPELMEKYSISSIGLFGSVVRNDFSPTTSDIDIIVDFSKPIGVEFIDLADYLEQKIKRKIDLVSRNGIKQKYYQAIESDIIYV
jgi:predicted nucleotidyltransferase